MAAGSERRIDLTSAGPLVECIPNFSEGRDLDVIARITREIEAVPGTALLHVDPGRATNRTVVTFAGHPEAVIEAAFGAIARAAELIDMRQQQGEHPRIGATDVCPLVPISGLTMRDTVHLARRLGERVGRELDLPVYLYEHAATSPERRNLANIRRGGYEGLAAKLEDPAWQPDYGPTALRPAVSRGAVLRPGPGATVVGARDFLIAFNVNLDTTSARRATAVARDVRERGRVLKEDGRIQRDASGQPLRKEGLPGVKAIGWFIEEYGRAQVSLNVTDLEATPLHLAYEAVATRAHTRGLRATGSELIGLVPLHSMLEAGRYFHAKTKADTSPDATALDDSELIRIAVEAMGLDELGAFDPEQRILEYRLRDAL